MADREIGFVELTATTRIIFSVGTWKGQARASIRKFIASEKYAGPTKSGMSLDGAILAELLAALRTLYASVPTGDQNQQLFVGKTRDWEIRIAIIPPDEENRLPSVDIREFVDTARYSGPTKAGVRFSWDKLKQFVELLETLLQQLGVAVSSEATLFPDMQPKWVAESRPPPVGTVEKSSNTTLTAPDVKAFPEAFLPAGEFGFDQLKLPNGRMRVSQDRDGKYFVTDDDGFYRSIRNEVEGKFFLYAQLQGCTELRLPKEMFKVFSTVAAYERHCRELRHRLLREFEARSRNRTLAEHMTRELMESRGFPIC